MNGTTEQKETTQQQVPHERVVMLHWYCFSYAGKDLDTGMQAQACTYVGYNEQLITRPMIEHNKKTAGVHDGAVLLAVSYLGYMTREQMLGA